MTSIEIACQSLTELLNLIKFESHDRHHEDLHYYMNNTQSTSPQHRGSTLSLRINENQNQLLNTNILSLNPQWVMKAHRPEVFVHLLENYMARVMEWINVLVITDPNYDVARYKLNILYHEFNLSAPDSMNDVMENLLIRHLLKLNMKHRLALDRIVNTLNWLSIFNTDNSALNFQFLMASFESLKFDFQPENILIEFIKYISELCKDHFLKRESDTKLTRSKSLPDFISENYDLPNEISQLSNLGIKKNVEKKYRQHSNYTANNLLEPHPAQHSNIAVNKIVNISNENDNITETPDFFVQHYISFLLIVHKHLHDTQSTDRNTNNDDISRYYNTLTLLDSDDYDYISDEEDEEEMTSEDIEKILPSLIYGNTNNDGSKPSQKNFSDINSNREHKNYSNNQNDKPRNYDSEVSIHSNNIPDNEVTSDQQNKPANQQHAQQPSLCSICLSKFKANQNYRQLPCHHIFHQTCCDRWLRFKRICPLCRASLFVGGNPKQTQ